MSCHGTVWMYAQFGYHVTYSFLTIYFTCTCLLSNCMCEICEMCKSTLACREPIATVRVENFEGVNFRAIQYSVLFGKFRG